ncbi:hypothetical protein K503DRAFT_603231 [Rhizopogon vinicolor AM-OR11-026]|uniref:Uncharacterized protein n=1 Tax=Rhizopogon vinicolor AM-OR11-026 TaxID=1314800 RepID=A0A1B7MIQ4_9AGAM|nr:hypothetical protein K503DRAFT_603231 [Rhizopogon vinicolor AM-OR11-026]
MKTSMISTRASSRTLFPYTPLVYRSLRLLPALNLSFSHLKMHSSFLRNNQSSSTPFFHHTPIFYPPCGTTCPSLCANDVDPRETRDLTRAHILTSPATGRASPSSHVCSI